MSPPLKPLNDRVAVCGQLRPADMPSIAAAGYAAVVNNRPEGEAMIGQPPTEALRRAAEGAGLAFLDLPFSGTSLRPDQVRRFRSLLAERPGKVVAFCKSGMRSTLMWAAAAIAEGAELNRVLDAARMAGQNLDAASDIVSAIGKQARD